VTDHVAIPRDTQKRGRGTIGMLRAAWQEYQLDHARYFATAMVYYALISLAPLLVLLLAVLGLLLQYSDVAAALEQQVLQGLEASVGPELRDALEESLTQLEAQSLTASVVGVVGLLLTGSALFRQLRLSFRAIWKYTPPLVSGTLRAIVHTTLTEYVIGFVMVLTGGALLLVALAAIALMQWPGGLMVALPVAGAIPTWLVALPGSLLIVGLTFALLFKFLPPPRLPWRHVWFAAVLCTVAWILAAEVLVLFGAALGGPSLSGAAGGLFVAMLWLNCVSQLLFYGAELCKVSWSRGRSAFRF
jgi:membrane protein